MLTQIRMKNHQNLLIRNLTNSQITLQKSKTLKEIHKAECSVTKLLKQKKKKMKYNTVTFSFIKQNTDQLSVNFFPGYRF